MLVSAERRVVLAATRARPWAVRPRCSTTTVPDRDRRLLSPTVDLRPEFDQRVNARRNVATSTAWLVIPCYDEAVRLDLGGIKALVDDPRVSVVLVDDGSTDATLSMIRSLEADHPERVTGLALRLNVGKGEAVRRGISLAVRNSPRPTWIGYVDADLATPPAEVLRLLDIAERADEVEVVLGSRVALLGRDVRRSRHCTGRMFATLASAVLDKPVYDTQCGAKFFRCTAALEAAIARPFHSRWAFDVELLGRLAVAGVPAEAFWEEPLLVWHDVADSRRSVRSSLRSTADLLPIWRSLRRTRW